MTLKIKGWNQPTLTMKEYDILQGTEKILIQYSKFYSEKERTMQNTL